MRILIVICAMIPFYLVAQPKITPVQKLKSLWSQDELRFADFSFLCTDLATGKELLAERPTKTVVPASTLKVLTTATALEVLGADFRYDTKIYYTGEIVDGVLKGNVVVMGSGDPCLGSDRFEGYYKNPDFIDTFVGFVAQAGIRRIEGNVIGDASLFGKHTTPRDWSWEDIGNYWGAIPCALSVYENMYTVYFESPKEPNKATKIVNISPPMNDLKFENRVLSSNAMRDNAYIFGSQFANTRWIDGTIPHSRSNFAVRGSIGNPALYLAQTLAKRLEAKGISISGQAIDNYEYAIPDNSIEIGKIQSPPLSDIVKYTNLYSLNLYAENLLRQIGLKQKKRASIWGSRDAVVEFWRDKGMDIRGLFYEDGSGLSMTNGITAQQMVYTLRYMYLRSGAKTAFINSLPQMGVTGTLAHSGRGTAAYQTVRAKTGTLSRTKSFAGYIECKSGKKLAFFAAVNNFTLSETEVKNRIIDLLSTIVESY